jgi:DNA-binding HxlR family transcriptional regulator
MRTGRTGPLKPFNLDASKVSLWLSCRLQCNDRPTAEWSLVRTFPRPQSNSRRLRYTHVPNCAWRGRTGKLGRCRAAEESVRGEFEGLFHCEFRRRHDTMNTTQGSKMPSPILIGRWTPKILFSLKERPHRHGELRRRIGSVSQRMLTRTLRSLESTGLISRRVTWSKAIAVEYSLTELGKTIIAPLGGMCRWAKRYCREVSADLHLPGPFQVQ